MVRAVLSAALLLFSSSAAAAQTLNFTTTPATAVISRIDPGTGIKSVLGTGSARLKLEKNSPNEITVEAEGYRTLRKSFPRGEKYPKVINLALTDRVVKLNVQPYDAKVHQNGVAVGSQLAGALEMVIEQGKTITVELKKPGFRTVSRVYRNQEGVEPPPVRDNMELSERVVLVTTSPTGSTISVDGEVRGETTADVYVPRDKCVVVEIAKSGYAKTEKTYCNKETAPPIPLTDSFTLRDRVVMVHAPTTAAILVDGREIGKGEVAVSIPEKGCVEIAVKEDGFVGEHKVYCNQENMPAPPAEESFRLTPDEAWGSSVASDQANVNFTIEIGPNTDPDQAWKLISQVVTSSFDVLEITDKETGYMRTAWQVSYFKSNTIRTRVIVKLGDTAPLKYVIKIVSEESGTGRQDVKENEAFRPWNRLLYQYKDIINELQSRLKS